MARFMRAWHYAGLCAVVVGFVALVACAVWWAAFTTYVMFADIRASEAPAYWQTVTSYLSLTAAISLTVAWLSPTEKYLERYKP